MTTTLAFQSDESTIAVARWVSSLFTEDLSIPGITVRGIRFGYDRVISVFDIEPRGMADLNERLNDINIFLSRNSGRIKIGPDGKVGIFIQMLNSADVADAHFDHSGLSRFLESDKNQIVVLGVDINTNAHDGIGLSAVLGSDISNILVAAGAGSGKSTLLRSLKGAINTTIWANALEVSSSKPFDEERANIAEFVSAVTSVNLMPYVIVDDVDSRNVEMLAAAVNASGARAIIATNQLVNSDIFSAVIMPDDMPTVPGVFVYKHTNPLKSFIFRSFLS